MKCEIWNCHNETSDFLCEEHKKLAENPAVGFIICDNCNAIVDIIKSGEQRHIDETKILAITGQYIFIKNCNYCAKENHEN